MKLRLDTHIFIALLKGRPDAFGKPIEFLLKDRNNALHLSVASLWEMSIKWRLQKLDLSVKPEELSMFARSFEIAIVPINEFHAVSYVEPEPPTRDPFDRMLLAQCLVEGMKLITIDRALADHPLSATHP